MTMVDHAPEITDDGEYSAHLHNYHAFLRVMWMSVSGIAVVLILLAGVFG